MEKEECHPHIAAFFSVVDGQIGFRGFELPYSAQLGGFVCYDYEYSTFLISIDNQPTDLNDEMISVSRNNLENDMTGAAVNSETGKIWQMERTDSGELELEDTGVDILDWFAEFARRCDRSILRADRQTIHQGKLIKGVSSFCRGEHRQHCSNVSHGVRVSISTLRLKHAGWVYQVSIQVTDGDADAAAGAGVGKFQLVERHWVITRLNSSGDETSSEDIRGPGVIGEFPTFDFSDTEASPFQYTSCSGPDVTSVEASREAARRLAVSGEDSVAPAARFDGEFRMRRENGTFFDVAVPRFFLYFAKYSY
ncbi:hypothetical protein ScalyP_jg6583 [Parmales sp. scaly parma]|nr:hypothetical protein ScalyP_jg6583 [Parmales sp. scaly parma]